MSLPLEFHPAVRDEINAAYEWYEQRRPELGSDFLDEIEKVFGQITGNSARFGFVDGDIRAGVLKRFPYAVYYRALDDRIRVLAVYHTSRNPARWQARV